MKINKAEASFALLAKTPSIGLVVRFPAGFIYVTSGIHQNPKVAIRVKASHWNNHRGEFDHSTSRDRRRGNFQRATGHEILWW